MLGLSALLLGLLLGATRANGAGDLVYVLTFEGAVTPVLEQYLTNGINTALESNAEAIVLQLDTPGGSVNVTKSITQEMLASPVPIVVYVAPAGAHAGSAGTFVTLAGHVAAMAPNTSIGAASPVNADGGDVGETMQAKIENILSADVENLSTRRGPEAQAWAIAAVREAKAATAEQALELGVIDFIADDVADLLDQLDGFEVLVLDQPRTLETADAVPVPLEMSALAEISQLHRRSDGRVVAAHPRHPGSDHRDPHAGFWHSRHRRHHLLCCWLSMRWASLMPTSPVWP